MGRETSFARAIGFGMLAAGVAVFAIRLHHAGPYALPEQGNLRAGLLALAIGCALLAPGVACAKAGASVIARRLLLAAAPVVLFFALYATLAEVEEVVVLRRGSGMPLRLWVVDHDGVAWVSMSRSKAEQHGLDGSRLELLRAGRTSCVVARLSHDPADNERTFRLRDEKYAVQRLGRFLGLFGDGPGIDTVTLRVDPCP